MPHQGIAHTKVPEHGCRDLAGESTRLVQRHVLRGDGDGRPGNKRLDLRKVGSRHCHRYIASRTTNPCNKGFQQSLVRSQAAIHLPIASDEFFLAIHDHQVKTILPMC
ncbi:hypothetical protein D3C71_1997610 [compost metagenome]